MSNRFVHKGNAAEKVALERFDEERREVERLKHLAVDLDDLDEMQEEARLQEIGIVNRQSARKAGLRNRKKERKLAIPDRNRRRRRRRR